MGKTEGKTLIPVEFQSLSNDKRIMGSILIYDFNKDVYFSNDFNWAKVRRIPASTFKIPHTLIALELGLVTDASTVFKWNGEQRALRVWQQDLTLKQAFHYSCVPCYQGIAKKVGEKRMNEFLNKFSYGKMDINIDNIDNFWLQGNSKINQFEEIEFIQKLYLSQLPVSKRTEQIFKKMFIVKQTNVYTLRSKTGLVVQNNNYNGWYVGYIETQNNIFFFATNISPKDNYQKSFNNKRKNITIKAFKQLGIIQ